MKSDLVSRHVRVTNYLATARKGRIDIHENEIEAWAPLAVFVAAVATGPLLAADQVGPKGIYVEKRETGVRFDVMLLRGAERRSHVLRIRQRRQNAVSQFALNRDACVYILTRTIPGDGAVADRFAGSKGIDILQAEDLKAEKATGEYRLLFPLRKTGLQNRLTAGAVHIVPGTVRDSPWISSRESRNSTYCFRLHRSTSFVISTWRLGA